MVGFDSPDYRVCERGMEKLYFDWDGRGNFHERLAFDLFGRDRSTETDVRQPIRENMADRIEQAGWVRSPNSEWSYVLPQ